MKRLRKINFVLSNRLAYKQNNHMARMGSLHDTVVNR